MAESGRLGYDSGRPTSRPGAGGGWAGLGQLARAGPYLLGPLPSVLTPAQGHLLALATGVAVAEVLEEEPRPAGAGDAQVAQRRAAGRKEGVRHPAGGFGRRRAHPLGGGRDRAQREQRTSGAARRRCRPERSGRMAGPAPAGVARRSTWGRPYPARRFSRRSSPVSPAGGLVWTGRARYPASWPSGAAGTLWPGGQWRFSPAPTVRNGWPRARRRASETRGNCWSRMRTACCWKCSRAT